MSLRLWREGSRCGRREYRPKNHIRFRRSSFCEPFLFQDQRKASLPLNFSEPLDIRGSLDVVNPETPNFPFGLAKGDPIVQEGDEWWQPMSDEEVDAWIDGD